MVDQGFWGGPMVVRVEPLGAVLGSLGYWGQESGG